MTIRECGIYHCSKVNAWRCCAYCVDFKCHNRCQNHPDRCKCTGDVVRKQGQRKIAVDHGRILELSRNGCAIKEIAKAVGCTTQTVYKVLADAGIHGRQEHG